MEGDVGGKRSRQASPPARRVLLSAARRLCISILRYVPAHAGRGAPPNQNCRRGPCPLRADIAPVVVPSLLRTERLTNSLDLLKVRLNFILPLVVQIGTAIMSCTCSSKGASRLGSSAVLQAPIVELNISIPPSRCIWWP